METNIKIFSSSQFGEIRTATNKNNEPIFCLSDVCNILGHSNPSSAINMVDEDERSKICLGRQGDTWFVSESGLYALALRSKIEGAKDFRKWVTSEVLPSIRKHGAYMTESTIEKLIGDPDSFIRLLTELKKEREEKQELQKRVDSQAQIVNYANRVLSSSDSHTATTIAAQFNMSATVLNQLLVKAKFLRKTGDEYSLSSAHQGKGFVEVVTTTFVRKSGEIGSALSLKYTEKGRMAISQIIERAKQAGVIILKSGRYFINEKYQESCTR
jgi:prophage antirepressor-like protein